MSAVIDTNVLVYDTFEDSVFHKEAKVLLDELDEWLIPSIVVYEYVWLLRELEVALNDAVYKVREYLLSPKAKLVFEGPEGILTSLSLLTREKLSLSKFNDKLILIVAKRRDCPLFTFDKKLRAQAASLGVPLLPERYPRRG